MSYDKKHEFTKENIDEYLRAVAKEYRRAAGKGMPAEMILIGGASVLLNYGFRNMTTDIDAMIRAESVMKDAINKVGDRHGLPSGWLNADFQRTESYSPKLVQYSKYYKTFANILTIRTVSAEYLIAMKLKSARLYKNDISDIIGILMEHHNAGNALTIEQVKKAAEDLYGGWEAIPEESRQTIREAFDNGDYEGLYQEARENEFFTRQRLLRFEKDYPGVVTESNVNDIIAKFGKGEESGSGNVQESPSLMEKLRKNPEIVKEREEKKELSNG